MTTTLRAALAARNLDIDITVADHERIAILGPNGAGKSTMLAVLAGILKPDSGRAELDGRILFDLGARSRRWVPPYARSVSLLAQDPLLFPHLSVLDNVAFGPRAAAQRTRQARSTASHWLEEVGAAEFADRKPAQLSGGQAQRVAIARALAANPRLLLLDEPMAALDVGAAPLLRRVLRRVLAERSAIIVTHDPLDALLLTQRVLVLDHGRVVEAGPTADVLRHPRTAFTARIAGLNMILGTAETSGVRHAGGQLIEGVQRTRTLLGEPAIAVFPPSAVSVYLDHPHGSPRNTVPVIITEFEPRDDQVRVRADTRTGQTLTADVTTPVIGELDLYPGKEVFYSVKATAVTIYPT
jgi:molybdate transport system ATP-binding protein